MVSCVAIAQDRFRGMSASDLRWLLPVWSFDPGGRRPAQCRGWFC